MEIVHQKLIMLLAGSALAIVMFKLDFERMVGDKFIVKRLQCGTALISVASLLGILSRIGLIGSWFYSSSFGFFIETVLGYFFGWALIIWAIIDWSNEHFDYDGKPLISSRQRRFSDKLTDVLVGEHNIDLLLNSISRYLLLALDCQALSFHQKNSNRRLILRFQYGLMPESADLIRNPSRSNELFNMVLREKQAVSSDEMHSMGVAGDIISHDGQIAAAFTIPIFVNDEAKSLLTIYSTRNRHFTSDDLDLLHNACSALSRAIGQEQRQENYERELHKIEFSIKVADIFDSGDSLIDGFIKASKFIYEQVPFHSFYLYIHDNGPIYTLDFAMTAGGVVYQKTGYFPKTDYPQLYGRRKESPTRYSDIVTYSRLTREYSSFILRIGKKDLPLAHLEIKLDGYAKIPDEASSLVEILGLKINHKLDAEKLASIKNHAIDQLGALKYGHELALSSTNFAAFLQEMAAIAVNSTPATYCRIDLSNPEKIYLRIAAVSQRRPLDWPTQHMSEIPLAEAELHKKALLENRKIYFDQHDVDKALPSGDIDVLMPPGTGRGIIIPLMINNQSVGLLTVGDFRDRTRCPLSDLSDIFVTNLASVISMAFTLQRERRHLHAAKEGSKKLTMKLQEQSIEDFESKPSLNIKSRLNGPLASIMASCEYLRESHPGLESEVEHFIGIIERNAGKIHGITSGFTKEMNVTDSRS